MRRITIITIAAMSLLSIFGCCGRKSSTPAHESDTVAARDGGDIVITFIKHASLLLRLPDGSHVYVDPVDEYADYGSLPKADAILITHSHYDHFDMTAIGKIATPSTKIVCDRTTSEAFGHDCITMTPGMTSHPLEGLDVEAVPAYNISDGRLQFHPREREDCGYVLTVNGTRIYIAGDTENNDDIKLLRNIDIAFLPVNQPYTMTVEQAVDAVKAIRPTVFYPYHYGGTEHTTDLDLLKRELEGVTEVRIRPLE